MENSEQLEKILVLGKLLVKELDLDPGVDTLGRWMAHYLAEKISKVELLTQNVERSEAQNECCELILKIWAHRNQMPRGRRPFENYEPILKVLESIDPDNEDLFFVRFSKHEVTQLESTSPNYESIRLYLESVLEIDKVARVWIENLLNQAALKVTDENTKSWLETATSISLPDDIHSINIIYKKFNLLNNEQENSSGDVGRLNMRIQQLEKFSKLNDILLRTYKDELERRQI